MRATDKQIKFQFDNLQDKLPYRITIDSNIAGYQLQRVMNAGFGVTPINYYYKSKGEFYSMLLAMNELLSETKRFNKDAKSTNEYYKDSHDGLVADLLKSDKHYTVYEKENIIKNLNNQYLSTNYDTYLVIWESFNQYDNNDKLTKLGILKEVYGCPSKHYYDTDPVFKVL